MSVELTTAQRADVLTQALPYIKKYYNKSLEIKGILLNKYNPRLILTKEVEELASLIAEQLGTKILDAKISNSISLAEAPAHGVTIIEYAPRSKACAEYRKLISEITGVTKKVPPTRRKKK